MEEHVVGTSDSLQELLEASSSLDSSIESTYQQEWTAKYFLIALNCINALLFVGCILSKNNVNSKNYQQLLTWVFVPAFIIFIPITIIGFCVFLTGATVNADFCAGGPDPGSPHATLQNFILQHGYTEESLSYKSLDYFGNQCQGENPVAFINVLASEVQSSLATVASLYDSLESIDLLSLSTECQTSKVLLAEIMSNAVSDVLAPLSDSLDETVSVLRCSSISPIFQDVYGVPCSEAPAGLAWSFGTLLAMAICAMTMITTRAALYNPIIQIKLKRRREKEFEDYKRFMSQYYETDDWVLEPEKKTKYDGPDGIPRVATFETESTNGTHSPVHVVEGPSPANESILTKKLPTFEELHSQLNASDSDDDSYSYVSEDSHPEVESSIAESTAFSSAISLLVDRFFNVNRKQKLKGNKQGVSCEENTPRIPENSASINLSCSESGDSMSYQVQADDVLNDSAYSLASSSSRPKAGLVQSRIQVLQRSRFGLPLTSNKCNTMLGPHADDDASDDDDLLSDEALTRIGGASDAATRQGDISMESDIITVSTAGSQSPRRKKLTVRDLVETPYRRVKTSMAAMKPTVPPKKSLLGAMIRSDDTDDEVDMSRAGPKAPRKTIKHVARTAGSKFIEES